MKGSVAPSDGLEALIRAEIERFHAFVAAWFRGEVERSEDLFRRELSDRLASGLINIQPAGPVLSRDRLVSSLFDGHGANPDFAIEIADVAILGIFENGHVLLGTYLEHQSGARNTTPSENTRRSSVLFRLSSSDRSLTWLHIHETGLPAS